MLTWSDIRAIDSISDPLGVVSVFVDRPDHAAGRLVRAVALTGELRRLEQEVHDEPLAAAYRECLPRIRPALARMLDGKTPGRAVFAPLSSEAPLPRGQADRPDAPPDRCPSGWRRPVRGAKYAAPPDFSPQPPS